VNPYRVIVADPPWAHDDALGRRGAAHQYPVMTLEELCAFHLPAIADDALLFLWRLSSMIGDALILAWAWGFRPVSEVVWCKRTKLDKPWFGMGRTMRNAHESALVCVRGRGSRIAINRGIRSVFSAPVPLDDAGNHIHSAKPDEFFDQIVEPLIGGVTEGGPCLELFARRRRAGWDQIGFGLPPATSADDDAWGYR
jgi:N6-adenosine-specific RNA methylase IME4